MKVTRLVFAAMLFASILFANQDNRAEARDVWVANSGGLDFYVMTEEFGRYYDIVGFEVVVKITDGYRYETWFCRFYERDNDRKYFGREVILRGTRHYAYGGREMSGHEYFRNNYAMQQVWSYCLNNLY